MLFATESHVWTGAVQLPLPPKIFDKKLHLTSEFLQQKII